MSCRIARTAHSSSLGIALVGWLLRRHAFSPMPFTSPHAKPQALTTNSLLMRQRPGLFDSTIGVIFLGTPHSGTVTFTSRGVSTKAILTVIAMYSELRQDPEVLSGLESERGTLLEVSQDFLTLSRSPQGVNLQLINFFEQRSSKVGKQVGRDDLQVPMYKMVLYCAKWWHRSLWSTRRLLLWVLTLPMVCLWTITVSISLHRRTMGISKWCRARS